MLQRFLFFRAGENAKLPSHKLGLPVKMGAGEKDSLPNLRLPVYFQDVTVFTLT